MSHHELYIPGRVVPKARPRFNSHTGRAYMPKRYTEWLDMAADTIALTLRKPRMDGPLLLRAAFTPEGVEVVIADCAPVEYRGHRGDLDNSIGSVMDALQQGEAIRNDRHIVRIDGWFV